MDARIAASLTFVAGCLYQAPTWSDPPTPFSAWSVSQGRVEAPCPAGVICSPLVSAPDFVQRRLTDPATGLRYLQTIVADVEVDGSVDALRFAGENFVFLREGTMTRLPNDGVSVFQRLGDEGAFDSAVALDRGWAAEPGMTGDTRVRQLVSDPGSSTIRTDDFNHSFQLDTIERNYIPVGGRIVIDQVLGLNQVSPTAEFNDWQVMSMIFLSGELQTSTGQVTLPGTAMLTWEAGDEISVRWVGQVFEGGQDRNAISATFGYQAFDNKTTAEQIVYTSLSDAGPLAWPDPFGPPPSIPIAPTP